jgi:hypothetical protein
MILQLSILIATIVIYFITLVSIFNLLKQNVMPLQFNWLAISITLRIVADVLQTLVLLGFLQITNLYESVEISLILMAFIYLIMFFSRHNKIFLNKAAEKFLLFICFFCIIIFLMYTIQFILHISSESFLTRAFDKLQPSIVIIFPIIICFYLFFTYLFQFTKLTFHFKTLLILLNILAIFLPFQLNFISLPTLFPLWYCYYGINFVFNFFLYQHISYKKGRYLND